MFAANLWIYTHRLLLDEMIVPAKLLAGLNIDQAVAHEKVKVTMRDLARGRDSRHDGGEALLAKKKKRLDF